MITKTFKDVKISGIACALPKNHVMTDSYTEYFGEEVIEQFKSVTGIKSRHLSNGKQTASDLCFVAARELLDSGKAKREDIDGLLFFTQTPDYRSPSTAFVLQHRLGLKEDCVTFDVNLGCSAFVNALYTASSMISGGGLLNVLCLIGDARLNHPVYMKDKSSTLMFGDAGSAILISKITDGGGGLRCAIRSDGSGYKSIIRITPGERFPDGYPEPLEPGLARKMNGDDIFIFSMTKVPALFKEFFAENGCSMNDYDYCVLHQANLMILKTIAKKLKLPPEKMPVSLDIYGNTDGASIPMSIVDLIDRGNPKEHMRFITSGFGVGLSWALADFELNKSDVLPPVFTDEYYKEGFEV